MENAQKIIELCNDMGANNILNYEPPYYIAHQCNCTSKKPMGLSAQMFKKYPEANDYKNGTHGQPGTIKIHGHVINMFAQINTGKPKNPETKESRLELFKQCLAQIETELKGETVVFPNKIGCGLAGGDWTQYEQLLNNLKDVRVIILAPM